MRMISNDLLELQSCGTTSTFTVLLIEKCVIFILRLIIHFLLWLEWLIVTKICYGK